MEKKYLDVSKLNTKLPTMSDGENPLVFMSDLTFAIAIAMAETGDVMEVVHAAWVENDDGEPCCSNCRTEASIDVWEMEVRGKKRYYKSPFCPNCGAKMGGGSV
jgi:hypothetical protein